MNKYFIGAVFAVLLSPNIAAANDSPNFKAKNHSCGELQEIVQKEKVVRISGFGTINVYADELLACSAIRGCRLGLGTCEPYKTNWRTTDKKRCYVGFSCRFTPDIKS